MEWTQRILAVGEAFAGCECASLRTLLERQSGKFFRLYHHSNIEVGAPSLSQGSHTGSPAELPSVACNAWASLPSPAALCLLRTS